MGEPSRRKGSLVSLIIYIVFWVAGFLFLYGGHPNEIQQLYLLLGAFVAAALVMWIASRL
jgi:hypothetical protein